MDFPRLRLKLSGMILTAMAAAASLSHACSDGWSLSLDEALKDAASGQRLAVISFTGSDWSPGSVKLDESVLMNPAFSDFAVKHFALANADFPQRKTPAAATMETHTAAATRYKIRHFPTLLALNADGTEFARFEYKGESAAAVTAVLDGWQQRFAASRKGREFSTLRPRPPAPSMNPWFVIRALSVLFLQLPGTAISAEIPDTKISDTAALTAEETKAEQENIIHHAVVGTVRSHRDGSTLAVIAHEEIPGYMEAMTMPLVTRKTEEWSGINVGDRIRFRLNVTSDDCWIDQIEVVAKAAPAASSGNTQSESGNQSGSGNGKTPPAPDDLQALRVGQLFPDFALTDHLGKKRSLADYRGQVFALTFIYTNCPLPTFCPRVNRHYQEVQKLIANGKPAGARLISVTIDPARDTVEHLARFAASWRADPEIWRFATGTLADITALSLRCGLSFWDEKGQIQHNLRTIVVDGGGRVRHLFQDGEWSAAQLASALEAAGSAAPADEKK